MRLNELTPGRAARIESVGGKGALRQHFLDMGVIPGAEVTMMKLAPMGDPMQLLIHGYELTLRLADAEQIVIVPLEKSADAAAGQRNRVRTDHPGLGEEGKFHPKGSGDPLPEAKAGWDILRALNLRTRGVQLIACPTCGRTCIPVEQIARRVEAELSEVTVPLKVAVMGCIVNGLGEGREADVGIAGGRDGGALFVKGQEPRKVQGDLAEILIAEVRRMIAERV